jgi:hypothetical protein
LLEAGSLSAFPILLKGLHCPEHKSLLVVSKGPVLAHGVQAHNQALFGGKELCKLNGWPFANLGLVGLFGAGSFLLGVLLILESLDFFLELGSAGGNISVIGYSCFKCFVGQTRLVNKRHGHKAAEAGHSSEPHRRFANNFGYKDELARFQNVIVLLFGRVTFFLLCRLFFVGTLIISEHGVRARTILL